MSKSTIKGQGAVEFILIFVIFLLFLAVALVMSFGTIRDVRHSQVDTEARNLLNKMSSKIDTTWMEGEGFSTNLTLPNRILSFDYSVNISSNELILCISNETYSKYLVTKNILGVLKKGVNMLKNEGNVVVIVQ